MARGEQPDAFSIGQHDPVQLAPMLASRATMLLDWSGDDSFWEEDNT